MTKSALVAASLALLAGAAAAAAPADIPLGAGPGDYQFSGSNVGKYDTSFFITLDPGTYTFSGDVFSKTTKLKDVWLSFSDDPVFQPNSNDLTQYTPVAGTGKRQWDLSDFTLTLTETTTIFLNVDAVKNRKTFNGTLDIVAAPIPEPATAALLLAGLGMLGFIGRRRRG